MKTEIISTFTGQVMAIAAGAIEIGSSLITTEAMKMAIKENSPVTGVFESLVAVGAFVIAGETVIGYFTHEE